MSQRTENMANSLSKAELNSLSREVEELTARFDELQSAEDGIVH